MRAGACEESIEAGVGRCVGGEEEGEGGERRRGVVHAIVCVLVPCLWCVVPARGCYARCKRAGVCGPRHKAVQH